MCHFTQTVTHRSMSLVDVILVVFFTHTKPASRGLYQWWYLLIYKYILYLCYVLRYDLSTIRAQKIVTHRPKMGWPITFLHILYLNCILRYDHCQPCMTVCTKYKHFIRFCTVWSGLHTIPIRVEP